MGWDGVLSRQVATREVEKGLPGSPCEQLSPALSLYRCVPVLSFPSLFSSRGGLLSSPLDRWTRARES